MSNSTNIEDPLREIDIKQGINMLFFSIIWLFGIVLSILSITVTMYSRSRLLKVELAILMAFNVGTMIFKFIILLEFSLAYGLADFIQSCGFTLLNASSLVFVVQITLTVLYYSIFQVSNMSRHPFLLVVRARSHNMRTFLVIQALTILIGSLISFAYLLLSYLQLQHCPGIFYIIEKYMFNFMIIQFVGPTYLPVVIYLLTTAYIFYSRFIRRHDFAYMSNRQELARYRRNLRLLAKFFALSLTFILSGTLLNGYYILLFFYPNSIATLIVGYVGFSSYNIQCILIVYVHSILKVSFRQLASGLFTTSRKI